MPDGAVGAPRVTFPPAVRDVVEQEYAKAKVILEYGSGGSTGIAAQNADVTFSVETDTAWIENMRAWLSAEGLMSKVVLHHADIGPTQRWGKPKKFRTRHLWKYWRYPRSVWERSDFVHPDVVLIDGRFRVSCFLWVMENISRPTRVLFDDYATREDYHYVERYQKPITVIDRMAVFEITRQTLPTSEWIHSIGPRMKSR